MSKRKKQKEITVIQTKETVAISPDEKEEYEVVELEIRPANIVCPDCGGITLEGLDFCDKCGGEINPTES